MLVASLRDVIRKQAEEIESLQKTLRERTAEQENVSTFSCIGYTRLIFY